MLQLIGVHTGYGRSEVIHGVDLEVPSIVTLDTGDGLPSNNLSLVIVGPSHQKLTSWLSGGGTPGGTFTYSGL